MLCKMFAMSRRSVSSHAAGGDALVPLVGGEIGSLMVPSTAWWV